MKEKEDKNKKVFKKYELKSFSPGRNMNKTNPFLGHGESMKQTGDDQEQLSKSYEPQFDGWAPMRARRNFRKTALFDTTNTIPGMADPSQGNGSPFMGAGEAPNPDRNQPVVKNWDEVSNYLSDRLKRYLRTKNGNPVEESDQEIKNYNGEE